MSVAARKELIAVVRRRYREADRDGKKLILDELTNITGYHRKHAIRLLRSKEEPMLRERSCRLVYDEAVNESLVVLWEAADRICSKRLKAALPLLLDSMEKYGHLKPDDSVRSQLLAMSAAIRHLRSLVNQAPAVISHRAVFPFHISSSSWHTATLPHLPEAINA